METQFIKLNMIPSGVNPCFHISQYDIGRSLGFIVYNGSEVVDLDSYTCTIEATRSDGVAITASVATDDNVGTFETTATMTNKADKYRAQFVIVDENSKRIASLPFDMDVVKAAMDENAESIEEDASLYQQYTEAVQGAIAEANANIQAEKNARIAAVAAEATARANADTAEATARANAVSEEATTRANADTALNQTLTSELASEASARSAADTALGSRIDQIVAPSGEAPSAAEVSDARIGADGVIYSSLGAAIRNQVTDLTKNIRSDESQIYSFLNIKNFDVTNGWKINPDTGYSGPDASYKLMKYRVSNLSDKMIKVVTDGYFQFQTSENVPQSGTQYIVGRTYKAGTYIIEVPDTALYLIASILTTGTIEVYDASNLVEPIESAFMDSELDIHFELGSFNGLNGKEMTATDCLRSANIPNFYQAYKLVAANGYLVSVWVWDSSYTFLGKLQMDGTLSTSESAFWSENFDLRPFFKAYPDVQIKLLFKKTDSSTMTVSDKSNLKVYNFNIHNRFDDVYGALYSDETLNVLFHHGMLSNGVEFVSPIALISQPISFKDMPKSVNAGSGYTFSIWGYDTDGTFLGKWEANDSFSIEQSAYWTNSYDLRELFNLYPYITIKLLFKRTDNANIAITEASNITITKLNFYDIIKNYSDAIPKYWLTQLKTKVAAINSYISALGRDGDAFQFITDIHYPEFNFMGFGRLLRYIERTTPITKIFIGGDIIHNLSNAARKYGEVLEELGNSDRIFAVSGNHDADYNKFYIMQKRLENYITRDTKTCFYLDNTTAKIRYVFLNSRLEEGNLTNDQIIWAKNVIDELTSGWHYIIVTHGMWIPDASAVTLEHTDDYILVVGLLNEVKTSSPAKFIAVVCGHCHRDYNETTEDGFLMIGSTCDANGAMAAFDPVNTTRKAGTTSEHSFDVYVINTNTKTINITKIGVGSNRTFTYA